MFTVCVTMFTVIGYVLFSSEFRESSPFSTRRSMFSAFIDANQTYRLVALALCVVVTTGCASSGSSTQATSASLASGPPGAVDVAAVETDLRTEAGSWEGVPHRWGGTSRRGIDCSGLTQVLYARTLGLDLPRDTDGQARTGDRVRKRTLQPGDLVFFKTGRKTRHVGVYLSDGEFVHASSSSGVMVSSLSEAYWRRTWWHARRVLPEGDAGGSVAPRREPRTGPEGSRAGW